jgi:hypothetical protein
MISQEEDVSYLSYKTLNEKLIQMNKVLDFFMHDFTTDQLSIIVDYFSFLHVLGWVGFMNAY